MDFKPVLYVINYLQCQKGFRTRKRVFETPYFLYVHKGKGVYIIGDRQYQCNAGDLFFCPGGVPNTIIADDDDPYLLSGVDFTFGSSVEDRHPSLAYKEHLNLHNYPNHPQFLWIAMELIQRNTVGDARYEPYVQSLFKAWLLLVENLSRASANSSIAENAAAYLAANVSRNLSLRDISHEFRYHPNYLNRIFKKRFGITLKQYHNELRIKKAMQLLTYSRYDIGEIAVFCGFEDSNYFSRLFKQKTSQSPLQYRCNIAEN